MTDRRIAGKPAGHSGSASLFLTPAASLGWRPAKHLFRQSRRPSTVLAIPIRADGLPRHHRMAGLLQTARPTSGL